MLRIGIMSAIVTLGVTLTAPAVAQDTVRFEANVGAGGTYYCLVSRCNTGTVAVATFAAGVTRNVFVEAGVRRHWCFDCDNFLIVDGTVGLALPGRVASPFAGIGAGVASDAEFMGSRWGPQTVAGLRLWPASEWGLQASVRGRTVGRGDGMGEAVLMASRRFR